MGMLMLPPVNLPSKHTKFLRVVNLKNGSEVKEIAVMMMMMMMEF
jgi:hypothetical protein